MRLLHSRSLQFEQFMGDVVPRYAILSHRWLEASQEVTFQDMCSGSYDHIRMKQGFNKIDSCAKQAIADELDYVWVDTCCIDKTSSAELSEAINSMYKWYKDAEVCYALLGDVSAYSSPDPDSYSSTVPGFKTSNWFTRGWTLQELIAPSNVVFYSMEWQQIGTKKELVGQLKKITGVTAEVLEGSDPNTSSIAQRMSWAASRVTTRIEDMAYCLLGIFNVNMPLLYGEGAKAFIRLQEEIVKTSDDQSIFAWEANESEHLPYVGLLASSPSQFAKCGNIRSHGLWSENEPCSMTSKGLCTTLRLSPNTAEKGTFYARLECTYGPLNLKPIISLQLVSVFDYGNQYVRIQPYVTHHDRLIFAGPSVYRSVYVRQDIAQLFAPSRLLIDKKNLSPELDYFWIRSTPDFDLHDPVPQDSWNSRAKLFSVLPNEFGKLVVTHLAGNYGSTQIGLFFGSSIDSPGCWLADRNVTLPHAVLNRSKFGTKVQCVLRTDLRKSTIYATATTDVTTMFDKRIVVITLFVKTVQ